MTDPLKIANDPAQPAAHRARALCRFFQRHFTPPMDLAELAALLEGSGWLESSTIEAITHLKGEIAVRWIAGQTVIAIHLFAREIDDPPVLYLRLSQRMDAETFVQMAGGAGGGVSVLEAACNRQE